MNIWHYIHPHYRYDIQEMKIVLAKQLPFSFYLVIIEWFSHSKFKEVLYQSISVSVTLFPRHDYEKIPLKYFTSRVLELKADRQSYQK